jgi:hypothetical protein
MPPSSQQEGHARVRDLGSLVTQRPPSAQYPAQSSNPSAQSPVVHESDETAVPGCHGHGVHSRRKIFPFGIGSNPDSLGPTIAPVPGGAAASPRWAMMRPAIEIQTGELNGPADGPPAPSKLLHECDTSQR